MQSERNRRLTDQPFRAPHAPEAAAAVDVASLDDVVAAAAEAAMSSLEDDKAENIVTIDLRGKSPMADMLIVASGRSQRHVGALAEHLMQKLKDAGVREIRVEGLPLCDWVLVDAGDIIVHLFRPEVRDFYAIEKIWSMAPVRAAAG